MIVVKLEMWPFGDESKAYPLGRTYIWNKGSGTQERGDYGVAVAKKGGVDRMNPLRSGTIENYPRLSYSVWRLIIRALKSAFPEEK
jgi:hypothetical protein